MKFLLTLSAFLALSTYAQSFRDIRVPKELQISKLDPVKAKALLESLNVKYLWKMDESGVFQNASELVVTDFMQNSVAHSEGSLVSVKTCKRGTGKNKFVLFERPSPDYPVGGYLKVDEDFPHSLLDKNSEFTIGGWFKQYPRELSDFRYIEPTDLVGGYHPVLSRYSPTSSSAPGSMEWMFHMTTEIAYFNINRGFTGQNDMNVHTPWWAHTFGTCYEGGQTQECWHYVSVAVKPAENKVQFVIVRQIQGIYGSSAATDFLSTGITSAYLNNIEIPTSPESILKIGAHETSGTHGIIRGLYFAKKALSPEESKAISNYTSPTKDGFRCGGLDLR